MSLPKRPIQHVVGDRALVLAREALPENWISREQAKDYGIDLEVELASDEASGRIFKVQVKGHREISWTRSATFVQRVDESTARYWLQLPVPIVLFLVDVSHRTVYWAPTGGPPMGQGRSFNSITVSRDCLLPLTSRDLAWHVVNWIDGRTSRRLLYGLPLLAMRVEERLERLGYDSFLPLEEEDAEDTRDLYETAIAFARAVGLNMASVIPWELWVARSNKLFGDSEAMYWGVHDELIRYLKGFFRQAVEVAVRILDAQVATPQNAGAKAYASRHLGKGYISWRFDTGYRQLDKKVWEQMEAILGKVDALEFTFSSAPRGTGKK